MKIIHRFQLSHVTVLTGYRMLPRKDLVKAKVYFLIDAACAALAFSFHRVSTRTRRSQLIITSCSGPIFLPHSHPPAVATYFLLLYLG